MPVPDAVHEGRTARRVAPEHVGAVLERVPEAFPIGEVVEQGGSERVLLD